MVREKKKKTVHKTQKKTTSVKYRCSRKFELLFFFESFFKSNLSAIPYHCPLLENSAPDFPEVACGSYVYHFDDVTSFKRNAGMRSLNLSLRLAVSCSHTRASKTVFFFYFLQKIMPFYRHLGTQPSPHFQSPAKVFARLKSKVQQEGVCADNGVAPRNHSPCSVNGNYGGQLRSPRKTTNGARMEGDLPDSRGFGYRDEAKAVTISPIPSPQKNFDCWNLRSSLAKDKPLVPGRGREYKPSQAALLQSAALPQGHFLDNRKQIHEEPPRIRDVASGVFSPIKNRLRKRKCESWEWNNISSSTKIHNDSQSPQNENIPSADSRGEGCVVMEDLVHGPGFSAVRPDMSDFPQRGKTDLFFIRKIYNFSEPRGKVLTAAVFFF